MSESTMLLQIPEPSRFHCEPDEDHFFAWLDPYARGLKVSHHTLFGVAEVFPVRSGVEGKPTSILAG